MRVGPSAAEPYARGSGDAPRAESVVRRTADDALLERRDVLAQADAQPLEVENRIDDQLPGAVEGDVASAVDVVEPGAEPFERFAPDEQVLGMAAFAQRIDGRMFDHQQRAGLLGRATRRGRVALRGRCGGLLRSVGPLPGLMRRGGCAGGRLGGDKGVEKLPLEFPAAPVVHRPEVAQTEFHRYKLFTLRRASSARYDDRTSGALAQ